MTLTNADKISGLGLLSAILFIAPHAAFAGTYTWNGSSSDWESASAYDNNGEKPGPGDTVKIPAGKTATVNNDSIAFVSSLGRITMDTATSALTINISTNATLNCQVTAMGDISKEGSGSAIGTVTKQGTGELFLGVGGTSNSYRSQYYVNWEIEGGAIRMPTNSAVAASQLYFGAITVNEGATLYTANPGRTRVMELWGSGLVTNESAGSSNALDVYGFGRTAPSVFSGVIGGGLYLYSRGNVHLIGTNNTFKGGCWVWNYNAAQTYGTTGLKKLGMVGEPSSAGVGGSFRTREYSGRFLYLGTGETTDRTFQWDDSSNRPCEFDAGAVGGITFTGKWQDFNSSAPMMNRIVITGSNTSECVLANAFDSYYGYRITKKGSGTWRLADHADRKMTGVVAVQDGTLKFDSIAPAGSICSLGKATVLYADYTGTKSDDKKVDYALMLGGDSSTTGTLEYAGSDVGFCTNRPLMVKGTGRFRTSGGALTFGDVFADNDGGTLIFDAANGVTNTLANVADGTNGILSLVKEGAGTLRLTSGQTWSGSLDVRAGAVLVDSHYGYWRFTMKENAYACTNRYATARTVSNRDTSSAGMAIFSPSEFCLYSADGTRQNQNLEVVGDADGSQAISSRAATSLSYGQAGIENGSSFAYYLNTTTGGHLQYLFDGNTGNGNAQCIVIYCTSGIPYLDKPGRHCKIVMRLAEDADEITYFDIAAGRANGSAYYGRSPTAYSLEGSADGVFWEKVAEDDEAVIPATAGGWYSGSSDHTALTVNRALALTNVTSVAVARGATLISNGPVAPIKKLVLDAAGAGTIDGFEFAEEGELEFNGTLEGTITIPVTIQNSTTASNMAKWTVVSGDRVRTWNVAANDSSITISKRGMVFVIK